MERQPLNRRDAVPVCSFYVRTQVTTEPPTYKYDHVSIRKAPNGAGSLDLPIPPAVGDLVQLADEFDRHTGTHRVVERSWSYSELGSTAWPWGDPYPKVGPLLTLIVVPDTGPFRNEADLEKGQV